MFFDGVQRLPYNFWRRITWRCVNRPCFWAHTEVCSQHGFKRTQTMFSRQLNGWERGQTLSPRTRDRADVPPSALRLPVVCCCFAPTEWLPLSHWGLLFVRHLSRDPRSTTFTMPSCVSFSHLTFLIKIKHQHSPTCYHLNDILDDVSTVCSRSSWTRDTNCMAFLLTFI